MDPQATLFDALEAMMDDDVPEAISYLRVLLTWLEEGGFCPEVEETSLVEGLVVYRTAFKEKDDD